jgi:hypothetical protein
MRALVDPAVKVNDLCCCSVYSDGCRRAVHGSQVGLKLALVLSSPLQEFFLKKTETLPHDRATYHMTSSPQIRGVGRIRLRRRGEVRGRRRGPKRRAMIVMESGRCGWWRATVKAPLPCPTAV